MALQALDDRPIATGPAGVVLAATIASGCALLLLAGRAAHPHGLALVAVAGPLVTAGCAVLALRSVTRGLRPVARALHGLATGDLGPCAVRRWDGAEAVGASLEPIRTALLRGAALEREAEGVARHRQQALERMAIGFSRLGAGDLTARVPGPFAPEFDALRTGFNVAAAQLQATVGTIAASMASVRTSSGQVAAAANDLSARSEQQAASLDETVAALTLVTATVRQTADAARIGRDAALAARSEAERSSAVLREARAAMTALAQVSDHIRPMTGRGDETDTLIAADPFSRAQAAVEESGEILGRIVQHVRDMSDVVATVAAAAQGQAAGLATMEAAIGQLAQQTATLPEPSVDASLALARGTSELDRLTAQFQLDGFSPNVVVMRPPGRALSRRAEVDRWEDF